LKPGPEAVLDELVDAWNASDGARFASLFAADADYVTGDGEWVRGRSAIAGLVERAGPGPDVVLEDASVRVHGDFASVTFRWVARAAGETTSRGVVTAVLVRTADGWRFDRLQNTDATGKP
jgi:uncharacterized protein (TIGR02246 family)